MLLLKLCVSELVLLLYGVIRGRSGTTGEILRLLRGKHLLRIGVVKGLPIVGGIRRGLLLLMLLLLLLLKVRGG